MRLNTGKFLALLGMVALLLVGVVYAGPSVWTDDITKATGNRVKVLYAVVQASTSGDNTIVPAVTGYKIRVISYSLVCTSVVSARFESGAGGTAMTGQMPFAANGGISDYCGQEGCFETLSGQLLNLELSGAVLVAGRVSYILVKD